MRPLLLGFICCALTSDLPAAVLAQYDFPATNTFLSSDLDGLSTATSFTFSGLGVLGTSHGRSTATTSPNLNTIYTRADVTDGVDEASTVAAGDYYSFTVTPNSGFSLNLTQLAFRTDATYSSTDSSYNGFFFVRSSVDSFQSTIASFAEGTPNAVSSFTNRTVSLAGAAFQGITSSIEFRIYLYETGTNASGFNAIMRSDTYVLSGDVLAIPEPSFLGLLAFGSILFLRRPCRRTALSSR